MATQIELKVHPDGSAEIHVASILYDLYEDFRFFRNEAKRVGPTGDRLMYKRFARAAIISFSNYFDGVLNRWVACLSPQTNLDEAGIGERLAIVRREIRQRRGRPLEKLDLTGSRRLRNRISHLKLGDSDLDITRELLDGRFLQDVLHLENWLRVASKRLGLQCHPNVDRIAESYIASLGGRPQ